MTAPTRSLPGILPAELEAWLASRGERSFRTGQILAWVHRRSVLDPAKMTDLSAGLREALRTGLPEHGASVAGVDRSADGTRKLRIRLGDGEVVETVLIPEGDKLTQCLSTQVGCAFACAFCRSGVNGLCRDLRADEILAQVHLAAEVREVDERLAHLVFMGSGEPLANYGEVSRALTLITAPEGLAMSTRRVTLSTVGLPRGIARLGRDFDGRIGLAVSLHGADDATRARLVPGATGVKMERLVRALRAYPLPSRRRITVEYVLVAGENDTSDHAEELARVLRGIPFKINLIPLNPHDGTEMRAPSTAAVEAFQQVLVDKGITAMIRRERGGDIGAACGQLAAAALAADEKSSQ